MSTSVSEGTRIESTGLRLETARRRRYLVVFLAVCGVLLLFAVLLSLRQPDWNGQKPVDFAALGTDNVVVQLGLTRRQRGLIKIRYLEQSAPPRIGVFGNHQVWLFGIEAFDRPWNQEQFFNFAFANLGLPDVVDVLEYAERIGKLPRDLIIVHVTTPHNDNGRYVSDSSQELPLFIKNAARLEEGDIFGLMRSIVSDVYNEVGQTLNYMNILYSLLLNDQRIHVVSLSECRSYGRLKGSFPPAAIRAAIGRLDKKILCWPRYLDRAFRFDGSVYFAYPGGIEENPLLELNDNPLRPESAMLHLGDEKMLSKQIDKIVEIADRNKLDVAFVIPPVYEDRGRDTFINEVLTRAFRQSRATHVYDHRFENYDVSYFVDYDHPSPKYFRMLAGLLRRDRLLDGVENSDKSAAGGER